MSEDFQYDVFLRHSSKDKAVVRRARLSRRSVRPKADLSRRSVCAKAEGRDVPVLRPAEQRSAASFPCGSTTPPSKAPWRNSFTSTGCRRPANRSMRSSSKPADRL